MFGSKQKLINALRAEIGKLNVQITEEISRGEEDKRDSDKQITLLKKELKTEKLKNEKPAVEETDPIAVLNGRIEAVSKTISTAHIGLLKNIMGEVEWDYVKELSEKLVDEREATKVAEAFFTAIKDKAMSIQTFIQLTNATISILVERCKTNDELSKALEKIDIRWNYNSVTVVPGTKLPVTPKVDGASVIHGSPGKAVHGSPGSVVSTPNVNNSSQVINKLSSVR